MKTHSAPDQTDLFSLSAPPERPRENPLAIRRRKIKEAFAHADEVWKEQYEAFVRTFAEMHAEFTAEDVRLAYESDPNRPRTRSNQASGGIFIRLIRNGFLEKAGTKISVIYGNNLQVYRKRI